MADPDRCEECGHDRSHHQWSAGGVPLDCQATVYTDAPLGGGAAFKCRCRSFVSADVPARDRLDYLEQRARRKQHDVDNNPALQDAEYQAGAMFGCKDVLALVNVARAALDVLVERLAAAEQRPAQWPSASTEVQFCLHERRCLELRAAEQDNERLRESVQRYYDTSCEAIRRGEAFEARVTELERALRGMLEAERIDQRHGFYLPGDSALAVALGGVEEHFAVLGSTGASSRDRGESPESTEAGSLSSRPHQRDSGDSPAGAHQEPPA